MTNTNWFFFSFSFVTTVASTCVYCATASGIEQYSGRFFRDMKPRTVFPMATDPKTAQTLWQLSEEQTGLHLANIDEDDSDE